MEDCIIQLTAYGEWRGINEFHTLGLVESLPVMVAAEPEAGGPLYRSMMQPRETLVGTETEKCVAFSIAGSITGPQSCEGFSSPRSMFFRLRASPPPREEYWRKHPQPQASLPSRSSGRREGRHRGVCSDLDGAEGPRKQETTVG
ncbi:MAG: hypothetical protein QXO30_03105 [Candidatus Caldarchaeum sp.]